MEALGAADPDRIGGYWLAGRLGSGGQGVVYEAYEADGARVALKVLHAADPALRDRFRKEIAAARRVASFCTAKVIDADPDAARPYVVSEYVEGVSLRHAGRRFTGDDLHRLATAVATALTAVHEAGVVHRDLKPDNVLLGPDGPRVIDFGIARTAEMSLTASGTVAGTPAYMAPEILIGQRAGPPADVFAWGCVMVFAATGEDPFRADDLGAVMHRVLTHHPDLGALPPSVRPLVAAALDKDPDRRPAVRDLLLALVGGSGEAGPAHGSGGTGSAGGDLLGAGRRRAGALHARGPADPALGALAEDAYATLGPDEREFVPELLLRLVAIDADGLETVRRAPVDELLPERPETRRRILDAFGYLITESDGEVAIARPAVLRAWPRLRSWVEADREGLPVLAEIGRAARVWDAHGRRDADLPQGSRLEEALGWAATGRRHLTLTPLERDFLTAAGGLTRRRVRRRRLLTTALAVLLVLSLAGGAAALYQGVQAAEQRDRVTAERDRVLGREAARTADGLRTTDPVKAMLLSVAAWRLAPGPESRSSLASSLQRPESGVFRPPPTPGTVRQAVSGDGLVMATVGEREVRVHDVTTGRPTAAWSAPELSAGMRYAVLSGSGRLLAVISSDRVTVRETRTGRQVWSRRVGVMDGDTWADPFFGEQDSLIVTRLGEIWDVDRGKVVRTGWGNEQDDFAVAPSGKLVAATRRGKVRLWRMPGLVEDRRFPDGCGGTLNVVAFSADGRYLVCGGERIELWDTVTGRRAAQTADTNDDDDDDDWLWPEMEPFLGPGSEIRLSADGRFAAGFTGPDIRVWNVQAHRLVLRYQAPGDVSGIWFAPDGRTLRYRLGDRMVALTLRPALRRNPIPGDLGYTQISPDARWVAAETAEARGIRLWDVPGRRFTGEVPLGDEECTVIFDRPGRSMAVSADSGRTDVYDVATRRRLWTHTITAGQVLMGRAFSEDGRFLATVYGPNRPVPSDIRLNVRDARDGRLISDIGVDERVSGIVYLPDGRLMDARMGRVIDMTTGELTGAGYAGSNGTDAIAVSPDGGRLAVGERDRRVTLWDTRTATALTPDLRVEDGSVENMRFSLRGDVLATLDMGEGLELWDTATRQRIGERIEVHDGTEYLDLEMAFTADGSRLRLIRRGGVLYELPVGPGLMAAEVCARAGRTLTRREWGEHLGGVPYRDVCAAS
ncbi:WD40 repeat domain-containing serine/threonine protein kinase [Streptosporangium sp. NPDC048047]|uniref:WD40 repeat domain-containing serine/threonine protein kinase n=1 Tax=Streptosporangium sp. NPDC048047 TaxID=3155748 RepID=UPI0034410B30